MVVVLGWRVYCLLNYLLHPRGRDGPRMAVAHERCQSECESDAGEARRGRGGGEARCDRRGASLLMVLVGPRGQGCHAGRTQ